MIPRLADLGTSFKGAAAYYLADKREQGEAARTTSERVAWTYTLNLPTDDPERAWRMMAHTAMAQAELKAAAGIKKTGRKMKWPVMAYSLSWSPDEKPPSPHEMLEAAKNTLAALGLDQHQALIVSHNDTNHPHVHVIVNRISPVDGVAHTGSLSKEKLSDWAFEYRDKRDQLHLCPARIIAHAKRQERRAGIKTGSAKQRRKTRPEWEAAQAGAEKAAAVAATHREMFGDQAAIERAGHQHRIDKAALFYAKRRAGRNAIRHRYQAVVDAGQRPELTERHSRLADALLQADPALGLATLTRDRSTFTREELARHVGRHTATVEAFQAVLAQLETSPELVPLGRDEKSRQRFTTREHQAVEQRMHDHARWLHAAPKREVRPLWPKGMSLSKDQDAALRHVVGAGGLASIVGYAGTGKSTLLAAARRSWEAGGLAVHGMTLSGIAADGLKNGSGIDSRTIHSRLAQWEQGIKRPGPKDVVVVDEAGMIGSRQMERILHYATLGNAKVVLVGDPEQLQAIEAGGAFRAIVDRFGAAKLETVRRQRTDWQQDATRELATLQTEKALDRYEQAGMVHAHETRDAAKTALIDRWSQARNQQPNASHIILAYTNVEVRDLNARARAVLKAAGELGLDVPLKTEAGRRMFAKSDRIYFLRNDTGLGVRNGSLGTILTIKGDSLVVRLDGDDRRVITFGLRKYGHIDHGYAATIHKSQGVTIDRAHLLATKNLNRHATYVAMTRHRDRLDLHWSADTFASRAKLVRGISREEVKDTSLDYEAAQPSPMRQRFVASSGPASPIKRMEQKAIEGLKQAAANEDAHLDQVTPALIEGPRPSDRTMILLTAEMVAYDRETAELAVAMNDRHEAEIAAEEVDRQELTSEAAINWHHVLKQTVEEEPDELLEALRHMPRREPKPFP